MEDIRRKSTSVRQLDLLITFMEAHTNLAAGKLRSKEGRALATRMWEQCADIVNSEGNVRTPKNWSRFWNDYKCRVRAKLAELNRGSSGTGGGPSKAPQLSPLEKRVAVLLVRDVGQLTGVHQDPSVKIQYVNAEEMGKDLNEAPAAANSSILNSSIIQEGSAASGNSSPVSQDFSGTLSLESEQRDSAMSPHVEECNQIADRGTTAPQTGRPRRRQLRLTRPRTGGRLRLVHQNNTAALDESSATIARIEEIRARTAETVATAALNMSNAMNSISNSITSISNAMTCLAESLRTYLGSSPDN